MKHFSDYVFTKNQSNVLVPVSGATVTVYLASDETTVATIYSDDGSTSTSNPLTTDSSGLYSFWIADGRYSIKVTGTNLTTTWLHDIEIADVTERTAAADSVWNLDQVLCRKFNHMVSVAEYPGADVGVQIGLAIIDLVANWGGGIVDCRSLSGANLFANTITVPGNITILLGHCTLSYTGTGYAFNFETTDADSPCWFSGIIGLNKWTSIVTTSAASLNVADAVIHVKWASHITLRHLTVATNTTATIGVDEEQNDEAYFDDVVIFGNTTNYVVGQCAWRQRGVCYGHYRAVSCSGSEYAWFIDNIDQTIPSDIRTALSFLTRDGFDTHWNDYLNIQAALAWKSGWRVQSSVTSCQVWQNQFRSVLALGNGLAATDADTENGVHFIEAAVAGVEGIRDNVVDGIIATNNWQHGVVLEGAASRNTIRGIRTQLNGALSANPSYGLWLKNGTGGAQPVENIIQAQLGFSIAVATSRAYRLDSSAARNKLTIQHLSDPFSNGTVPYTLSNTTNIVDGITDVGSYSLGTFNVPVAAGYATTTAGTIGYDSTQGKLVFGGGTGTVAAGSATKVLSVQRGGTDASTGLVAATINTTETVFATSYTLPANYLIADKAVRVVFVVDETTSGAPVTQRIRVRLGGTDGVADGTVVYDTGSAVTPTINLASRSGIFSVIFVGTAAAGGSVSVETAVGSTFIVAAHPFIVNTVAQPVSVATNGALPIQLSVEFGGNTAGNTVKLRSMIVEELN